MTWNRNNVLVYRRTSSEDRPALAEFVGRAVLAPNLVRVGIWDMDTSAGALPRLLDQANDCQQQFSFFTVAAPFQTGLARPGEHVADEWRKRTRGVMAPEAFAVNVSARAIVTAAEPVLDQLPVDWLVVVVSSMLADTIDPKDAWHNLFSTSAGNVVLVSTFELRDYAAVGGRPFEAALFGTVLSALLSAMVPAIEYHKNTTGSIFDFCENRADILQAIRRPHIDAVNRGRIPEPLLEPADALLECLKSYQGLVVKARNSAARRPKAKAKVSRRPASEAPAASPQSFSAVLKSLEKMANKKRKRG